MSAHLHTARAAVTAEGKCLQVLYIAGYGRSGSTVLNIVLGNAEGVFSAGELTNLTRRVWPNNEYCSCGVRVRECPFWSVVMERFAGRFGHEAIAEYARLQQSQELLGTAFSSLQIDSASYRRYTIALFELVAELSGKRIIIDSSKLPGRASALLRMGELDASAIHLVRDGRGVAWSLHKSYQPDLQAGVERHLKSRPVTRTALRWAMVNLGAEAALARLPESKSLRLRYEDFVSNPCEQLARIAIVLGMDLSKLAEKLQQGAPFSPEHFVAGSRIRMEGPLRLRLDSEWQERMPQRQQRAFQVLCHWLQRRYGYV